MKCQISLLHDLPWHSTEAETLCITRLLISSFRDCKISFIDDGTIKRSCDLLVVSTGKDCNLLPLAPLTLGGVIGANDLFLHHTYFR